MKVKVSEVSGPVLDYLVATAEGATDLWFDTVETYWMTLHDAIDADPELKPYRHVVRLIAEVPDDLL